jgi:hypothetical protein
MPIKDEDMGQIFCDCCGRLSRTSARGSGCPQTEKRAGSSKDSVFAKNLDSFLGVYVICSKIRVVRVSLHVGGESAYGKEEEHQTRDPHPGA